MVLNEECVVISGLLVGLNVIDCVFDLKGEDLDSPVSASLSKFCCFKTFAWYMLLQKLDDQ